MTVLQKEMNINYKSALLSDHMSTSCLYQDKQPIRNKLQNLWQSSKLVDYKPTDLQAWEQSSVWISGCKSWKGPQDLAPAGQEPRHCNPLRHQTIWCLEHQLHRQESQISSTDTDELMNTVRKPDGEGKFHSPYFLLEGSCRALTHIATGDALSWCSPEKYYPWVRFVEDRPSYQVLSAALSVKSW